MLDFHTHFLPPQVIEWLEKNASIVRTKWLQKEEIQQPFLSVNGKWEFELKKAFTDIDLYLSEQKIANVTHSLLSPIPQLFLYEFDDEITLELAKVYNHSIAEIARNHYKNLSALGTIPLNNPKKAALLLSEVVKQGLKGVIIGPGLPNIPLSDEFFIPFFEEANRLKIIIFIHPLLSEDKRLNSRMMPNLVGIPWETTVCATDILLSGLIDRYPNIKIIFAHGGGFLPYQIGRIDKGFEKWKAVSKTLHARPSEYLSRFWYDNVLWNHAAIKYLTEIVGKDRVVPGSDYPFDLCAWPPQKHEIGEFSILLNENITWRN